MVTEIVFFKLRPDIDLPTLLQHYEKAAIKWSTNPDLLHKWYYYDDATHEGGGIYIWRSREAAARWHDDEYKAMVEKVYGYPPEIRVLDALIYVDPTKQHYEFVQAPA